MRHLANSSTAHTTSVLDQRGGRSGARTLSVLIAASLLMVLTHASAFGKPFEDARTAFFKTIAARVKSPTQKLSVSAEEVRTYVATQVATASQYGRLRKEFARYARYLAQGNLLRELEGRPTFAYLLLRKGLITNWKAQLEALQRISLATRHLEIDSSMILARLKQNPRFSPVSVVPRLYCIEYVMHLHAAQGSLKKGQALHATLRKFKPKSARVSKMIKALEAQIGRLTALIKRIHAKKASLKRSYGMSCP